MKNVKAQAMLKIREAMSGLRETMKTASPSDRRTIHACMCELRDIKNELEASDEAAEETPEPIMDVVAEEADADAEEAPVDGDEELALSALELAAAALKAAAEEDEAAEEPAEEDEAAEEPAEEEAEEEPAEEEPAEEDDSEEGGADVDALNDEEIAALEAEGLLEGSALFKTTRKPMVRKPVRSASTIEARLARVQSRLNVLLAQDEEEALEEEMEEPLDEELPEGEDDGVDGADVDLALLDEDEEELTPEEIAMLEEMGVGLEASSLILASSNVLLAAKKWKKRTKSQKAASAKKWKGAKIVGRTMSKRTKKGKFYITVYRKKGNLTGSYNLFFKKKPVFKKLKAPSGASKAVQQRIAKHNMVAKAKVVKESPFAKKK